MKDLDDIASLIDQIASNTASISSELAALRTGVRTMTGLLEVVVTALAIIGGILFFK